MIPPSSGKWVGLLGDRVKLASQGVEGVFFCRDLGIALITTKLWNDSRILQCFGEKNHLKHQRKGRKCVDRWPFSPTNIDSSGQECKKLFTWWLFIFHYGKSPPNNHLIGICLDHVWTNYLYVAKNWFFRRWYFRFMLKMLHQKNIQLNTSIFRWNDIFAGVFFWEVKMPQAGILNPRSKSRKCWGNNAGVMALADEVQLNFGGFGHLSRFLNLTHLKR